ncbi:multiple inositol polyphosphate phosphatase 1-like [Aricia agestis]|uniref:multiple inositol polyphosphate phosphatase 1-like n=1 Tax=Aricia agestis TaxID=91739 RepID=UPI001C205BE6|nr:multiple inositol polyphosphate phosphatase 1-like [Aricia agestis]
MIWLALTLVMLAPAWGEDTCLSVDDDPYVLFASKTAYTFANRGIPINKAHEIPGCQPLAIYLLQRHGSNTPEVGEVGDLKKLGNLKDNVVNNYRNGNFRNTEMRMCASDVNLLNEWSWSPNSSFAGDLTSDGYVSTQQLAQAWKKRFPGLFTDNRHDYKFRHGNDQRMTTTFNAFIAGLFRDVHNNVDIVKETDDKLVNPHKSCSSWLTRVGDNNETLTQQHTFESKQEFKEMISNISKRMGFNYDVEMETVRSVYDMCRYNKAWDVAKVSPWCAVFSKEDLKRLEYSEDLATYYKYGYGTPLNRDIGCSGIKDMMDFFRMHADHDTPQQPRTLVQLTEADSLLLWLGAAGARRDSAPLTGDNYHGAAQSRRWSTSTMVPYNANLAAVLYKCTPNSNFQIREQFQVLFLENELPLYLEGCRVGLCDWSFVKNRLGLIADNCNLNFCNSASRTNSILVLYLGLFTLFKLIL